MRPAFVLVTVRGAIAEVDSPALVVSFDRVRIEVRDIDAATAPANLRESFEALSIAFRPPP